MKFDKLLFPEYGFVFIQLTLERVEKFRGIELNGTGGVIGIVQIPLGDSGGDSFPNSGPVWERDDKIFAPEK